LSDIITGRLDAWLADVVKDTDGSQVAALAKVVVRATESCTAADALDLVAYAHEMSDGSERAHAALAAAADGESIGSFGDVRPARLAGAAVAKLLAETNGDAATAAAIGTRSAALIGQEPQIAELPSLATIALARISIGRRQRPAGTTNIRSTVDAELGRGLGIADDANAATHHELRAALMTLRKGMRTAADRVDAQYDAVRLHQRLLDEETEVLWWTLGARSQRLDRPWKGIGSGTPLLAAFELFDKLTIDPPPVSAGALLRVAIANADIDPDKPIAFREAAAVALEASQELATVESIEGFCPVLAGLSAARGSGGPPSSPVIGSSALDLAEQLVHELALQRILGAAA
jgi:hypothetical protein